jgi:hypothetical protein
MSDERLRALERRWRETGTVQDEAAYLLERVRVGDLRESRLELAAHVGHQAAGMAIGKGTSGPRRGPRGDWTLLEDSEEIEWYRKADQLGGDEALLRVVAAVFNRSQNAHDRPHSPQSLLFVQLENATLSLAMQDFLVMGMHRTSDWGMTRTIAGWLEDWGVGRHSAPLRTIVAYGLLGSMIRPDAGITAQEAVREELAPWLLGYSDPVRERVEARLREAAGG